MEEYKFYPDQSSPYYKLICDEVTYWIKTNCSSMSASSLNKLLSDDKLAYEYYVQEQKRRILDTSIFDHFVVGQQFLKNMAKPQTLENFDKNFDDYYRFFPEEVFKIVSAIGYFGYNSCYDKSLIDIYSEETAYRLIETKTALEEILDRYSQKGGNIFFLYNYHDLLVGQIREKYDLRLSFFIGKIRKTTDYKPYKMSEQLMFAVLGKKDCYQQIAQLVFRFYEKVSRIIFGLNNNHAGAEIYPEQYYETIEKYSSKLNYEIEKHDKDMIKSYIQDVVDNLNSYHNSPLEQELSKIICEYLVESLGEPEGAKQKEDNLLALIQSMQSQ